MIAFPEMLICPAEDAGMRVPPDPRNFDALEFPHFAVFCAIQIGSPMPYWTAQWDNAKVIAAIPDDKIMSITFGELEALGISIGYSTP